MIAIYFFGHYVVHETSSEYFTVSDQFEVLQSFTTPKEAVRYAHRLFRIDRARTTRQLINGYEACAIDPYDAGR